MMKLTLLCQLMAVSIMVLGSNAKKSSKATPSPTIAPTTAEPTAWPTRYKKPKATPYPTETVTTSPEPTVSEPIEGLQCKTIPEILCETAIFDSFCQMLTDSDLIDLFEDADAQWTVFAPTNAALDNVDLDEILSNTTKPAPTVINHGGFVFRLPRLQTPQEAIEAIEDTEDALIDLLLFHLIPDHVIPGSDLSCDDILVMETGGTTTISCGPDSTKFITGNGNDELLDISVTDVNACNGVIHVLDGILIEGAEDEEEEEVSPSTDDECQSIQDVICGMEELSRMCSFLDDGRVLNTTLTSDKWTVFAPTDEAFENAFESIAGLTGDSILDIMKYHTVPGDELKKDDLICETNLIMGNDRASQTTCSTHSGFMYQRGPGNITPRTPRLIAPDNLACNGVVHIVSQILLPEEV